MPGAHRKPLEKLEPKCGSEIMNYPSGPNTNMMRSLNFWIGNIDMVSVKRALFHARDPSGLVDLFVTLLEPFKGKLVRVCMYLYTYL